MKNNLKRISTMALVTMIASGSLMTSKVHADAIESEAIKGRVVVSLGANLNENQKQTMLNFFNAPENAEHITVNNEEEYKYLGNSYTSAQIGNKTYSCGMVEFTESGGHNIKTSNLTVATSASLSSIMNTVGIYNANLVATSGLGQPVSGTGISAGLFKMVETATGQELDKEKTDVAVEEVKVSEEIASNNDITMEESNLIMSTIKDNVISGDLNVNNIGEIKQEINNVTNNYNINISPESVDALAGVMEKFGQLEYTDSEKKAMSRNLSDVQETLEDKLIADGVIEQGFFDSIGRWFGGVWNNITGVFDKKDGGILTNTNDGALGAGVTIESNNDDFINVVTNELGEVVTGEQAQEVMKNGMNFFQKAWDWVCGLFGNSALDKLPEVNENVDLSIEEDLNSEEESVTPEEENTTPEGLEDTLTPEQKEEMDKAAGSDLDAGQEQPESNPAPQE